MTSAYAAIAGNNRPITASGFGIEEPGWLDYITNPQRSLGSGQHEMMEDLLGAVVKNGTGRGARLRIPAFGKTGTSQNNRDALFIGYAGDLVVGVWIGNDDNAPLKGINGGGLPARIWRDFMRSAITGAAPSRRNIPKPKPEQNSNPDRPIEPLDLPEIPEIPINIEGTDIRINRKEGLTVSTEIGGVPLDVTLGEDGLNIEARGEKPERE